MTTEPTTRPALPDDEAVAQIILALAGRPGAPKTLDPAEPARALAGEAENWQRLLPVVKRAAVRLAQEGRLVIYRKGKPVDPSDFRGVYRLGLPHADQGAGTSAPVRPVP